MTRAETLEKARRAVCGEREGEYGSPEDNFARIAKLWNAYLGSEIVNAVDVSMMMSLLKIARVKTGKGSDDSFIDLAGYAACGAEIQSKERDASLKLAEVNTITAKSAFQTGSTYTTG